MIRREYVAASARCHELTETIDCKIPAKTAGKPLCAEDAIELLEAMWVGASRSRHCQLSAHRWTQ